MKSRRDFNRWDRWATTALATILFLLSATFSLTLLRNKLTGAATDTGVATIDSVDIAQAGTGQSVTINNVTMDENDWGTNQTRRRVLNNNIVKYEANYTINTPGTITLTMTMPANNTIDESSISSAAGCQDGSRLDKVAVDGQTSYTNNRATCVINSSSIGPRTWAVSTEIWGKSKKDQSDQIVPQFTVGGASVATNVPAIEPVGEYNYQTKVFGGGFGTTGDEQWYGGLNASIVLYTPELPTGVLGIEPVNNWDITLDLSKMPTGTTVEKSYYDYGLVCQSSAAGDGSYSMADNKLLINIDGIVALPGCIGRPSSYFEGVSGTMFKGIMFSLKVPVLSLSETRQTYTATFGVSTIDEIHHAEADQYDINYELSRQGYGSSQSWNADNAIAGGSSAWRNGSPVYVGETIRRSAGLQSNSVPGKNYAKNVYYCATWNASSVKIVSEFNKYSDGAIDAGYGYGVEYGVIGNTINTLPSSAKASCGQYGKDTSGAKFFKTLAEANQYANTNGLGVNAIRLWVEHALSASNQFGYYDVVYLDQRLTTPKRINFYSSAESDNWTTTQNGTSSDVPVLYYSTLTPGLVSASVSAKPSNTAPNTEDIITITPKTYNRDINAKVTVSLSDGLSPIQGSFYLDKNGNDVMDNGEELTNGTDYAILNPTGNQKVATSPKRGGKSLSLEERADEQSSSGEGSTITFDLDAIAASTGTSVAGSDPIVVDGKLPVAADNNGQGVVQPPIKFTVLINSTVPTPSTLTITAKTSGDGTDYAIDSFRTSTATVQVAERKSFDASLSVAEKSVYATDPINYNYLISNTTSSDVTDVKMVTVLPYDGDKRGTTGLTSFDLTSVQLSGGSAKLYYTTDELVRDNPGSGEVTWHEYQDGVNGITALMIMNDTLADKAAISMSFSLTNIVARAGGVIGNSISYITSSSNTTPGNTDGRPMLTKYLGDQLALTLSGNKDDNGVVQLVADMYVDSELTDGANNPLKTTASIQAKTLGGYNVTIASDGLIGSNGASRLIPAKAGKPVKGTGSWAVRVGASAGGNDNWLAVPTSAKPLSIFQGQAGNQSASVLTTYGIATANDTPADTYTATVRYTLTAEPKL